MGQTRDGAKRAAQTTMQRYGVNEQGKSLHHARIGAKGGRKSKGGPLKGNADKAKELGSRGGIQASKRRR